MTLPPVRPKPTWTDRSRSALIVAASAMTALFVIGALRFMVLGRPAPFRDIAETPLMSWGMMSLYEAMAGFVLLILIIVGGLAALAVGRARPVLIGLAVILVLIVAPAPLWSGRNGVAIYPDRIVYRQSFPRMIQQVWPLRTVGPVEAGCEIEGVGRRNHHAGLVYQIRVSGGWPPLLPSLTDGEGLRRTLAVDRALAAHGVRKVGTWGAEHPRLDAACLAMLRAGADRRDWPVMLALMGAPAEPVGL